MAVQCRLSMVHSESTPKDSTTRNHLVSTLHKLGYVTAEFTLSPLQFGIPNSRLRYYLLAKLSQLEFVGLDSTATDCLLDHIPPHHDLHNGPQQTSHTASSSLGQYLDSTMDNETLAQFRIPDRVLVKWGRLFDIVLPSATRTCCFTRGGPACIWSCGLTVSTKLGYTRLVERTGSILQTNENLDVCPFDPTGRISLICTLDHTNFRFVSPRTCKWRRERRANIRFP